MSSLRALAFCVALLGPGLNAEESYRIIVKDAPLPPGAVPTAEERKKVSLAFAEKQLIKSLNQAVPGIETDYVVGDRATHLFGVVMIAQVKAPSGGYMVMLGFTLKMDAKLSTIESTIMDRFQALYTPSGGIGNIHDAVDLPPASFAEFCNGPTAYLQKRIPPAPTPPNRPKVPGSIAIPGSR